MTIDALFAPFMEVADDYYRPGREAAARGVRVAGYLCSYAPQELLHAAGYLPVRILGRAGDTTRADELVQPFACSFARGVLDAALDRAWPFLRLIMFAHTCDTMQNIADLWRAHAPDTPVLIASVPTRAEGEAPMRYFVEELKRLRGQLERISGPFSDETLAQSVALYRARARAMQALYELRRDRPEIVTGARMMAATLAAFLMDPVEHLALLRGALEGVRAESGTAAGRPRVLVSGSMCRHSAFIELVESAGCAVVGDDLCVGSRPFALPEVADDDPIAAIARAYLARRPCPAFHNPAHQPGDALLEMARRDRADGVIFLLTSFCDPSAFDHVPMTKALAAAGMPALTLSVEQHREPPEQLRTRVAAFAEMLREGRSG